MQDTASKLRVCVVTGGSSGIGLATARRFAADGYALVICGRDEQRLAAAAGELRAGDAAVVTLAVDLAERDAGGRLIDFAVDEFDRVDVLVNNAGIAPLSAAHAMSDEDFESLMATNVRGVFATTKAVWPVMRRQGGGAIVNISSLSARDPFAGLGVYGASKAWVELFTKATAAEGREHAIRVFGVAPGAVDTPLLERLFPDIPAEARLQPEAVAELIYRLADQRLADATGQTVVIRK
ncbi:MAG: SDR family NAD(P)-dependent oxidoreductase [Planctomycetota bacterium]|nr:MAG: SDR family NAD(P)-dependent oxidoreductase [Planctomycetota bacterium]REJ86952.1 MAG: SDR family NAD(P)-dependent oxidoreductase [Planctomycetota bacterium]REK24921.1 MAG: SDR family NAD(P)-dependent oxidoreductase [Planctomycetota bacterium]REK48510.1 MAG: SDR family NAD(P)-dependent oxidoreductase [Planctomycetota bacterium]